MFGLQCLGGERLGTLGLELRFWGRHPTLEAVNPKPPASERSLFQGLFDSAQVRRAQRLL